MAANSFSQAQAQLALYYYEVLPYTYGPANIAAGTVSVFAAQGWTPANAPVWQARIQGLWVTSASNLQVSWIGDGVQYQSNGANQGFADASPQAPLYFSGSVYGAGEVGAYAPAIGNLSMQAKVTGSTVDDANVTYLIGMKRLTVAEKVLWQGVQGQNPAYTITNADNTAIAALPLSGFSSPLARVQAQVEAGYAPIGIEKELLSLRALRLGDHPSSGLYHVSPGTATGGTVFAGCVANPGEWLILEEVACEGAVVGSPWTLYCDSDQRTGYMAVAAAAFQNAADLPWRPHVPGLAWLNFRCDTPSGSVSNAPVRLRVGRYRLTDAWLCRLDPTRALGDSISNPGQPVDPALFAQVWAGI